MNKTAEQIACQTMMHAPPITFQINMLTFPLRKSPSALNNPAATKPHNPKVEEICKLLIMIGRKFENCISIYLVLHELQLHPKDHQFAF